MFENIQTETKQKIKIDNENKNHYTIVCIVLSKNNFPIYRGGEFGRLTKECGVMGLRCINFNILMIETFLFIFKLLI